MTKTEIEKAVNKHGSLRAAAKALRVPYSTLYDGVRRKQIASRKVKRERRRSLAEFRASYDKSFIVPGRIRAALKKVGAGWLYEVEFARVAGVSLADLSAFRDEFAAHVVTVDRSGRRAWAGTKSAANSMRGYL